MSEAVDVRGGTIWTMVWWGLKNSQKFISNLILTRLLPPEVFGIAAIGNTLISGISMFSDFGVQQNIVRSKRSDAEFYQTAWTVQLIRGFALTLVIMLLAQPLATFYGIDNLAVFLFIVAASNLAMGFNNVEVLRDFRHAKLQRIAIIDNVAALVGLVVMSIWAWFSPSYVALAVGALVSTATFAVGSMLAYPRNDCRLRLERDAVAELVGFGKWVLISTILAFATSQMDRLALGKLIPLQLLGLYSIAWIWASLPNQMLEQWAGKVFFPLASQHDRANSDGSTITTARRTYVAVACVSTAVIYAVSDILVTMLYTEAYQGVALLMRQLSVVFLLYTIEQSYSHLLIAKGRPRDKILGQALSIAVFAIGLLPVFETMGLEGVIGLLAATAVVRIVWMAYQLSGFRAFELAFDMACVGMFYLIACSLHAAVGAFDSRWYQVVVASAMGASALLVAMAGYLHLRRTCERT
ncbi:MAG: oligosaccharide flippase family protein [Pseudomonadota bacterium]